MLDLRFNNNKEFMAAHRKEYWQKMRNPHYALIEALTPLMLQIDAQMEVRPSKALSRIFRDTRFSRDKSPYRDHHWIAFRHAGEPRESSVLFWFEVTVEHLRWGLGFWGENRGAMDIFRRRLVSNPEEWLNLLKTLKKGRFAISGDQYKRMAIPEDLNPQVKDYYPLKDIHFVRQNADYDMVFTPQIFEELTKDFLALAPLYRLLRGYYEIALLEGA